jgi:hypothetical protein
VAIASKGKAEAKKCVAIVKIYVAIVGYAIKLFMVELILESG